MIGAIIIDDEKLARDVIREYIGAFPEITLLAECRDAHQAWPAIRELKPDLIFLDIQMPEVNGFELLKMLDTNPIVIFSTAFDQYAIRAFEVNAIDYLLKPYDQERFNQAVRKALKSIRNHLHQSETLNRLLSALPNQTAYLNRFFVKEGSKIILISVADITLLEAMDDYVQITTQQGRHLVQQSMHYFESRLDPGQFIRIHRSYLVRIEAIQQISLTVSGSAKLLTLNGRELPVSRSGYQVLKRILI